MSQQRKAVPAEYYEYELGDVALQDGGTLVDCKIAYQTYGAREDANGVAKPVIFYPTWSIFFGFCRVPPPIGQRAPATLNVTCTLSHAWCIRLQLVLEYIFRYFLECSRVRRCIMSSPDVGLPASSLTTNG